MGQKPPHYLIGVIEPYGSVPAHQQDLGVKAARNWAKQHLPSVDVEVKPCDDGGDPRRALKCAEDFTSVHHAVGILGTYNSLCTLELTDVAVRRYIPIISALSTASRLTAAQRERWFFRAALADRKQMTSLADWLAHSRGFQPKNIAIIYEIKNAHVQSSSHEDVRKEGKDVYGSGLLQDFLKAPAWAGASEHPVAVGLNRGLAKRESRDSELAQIFQELRRERGTEPILALGLLCLAEDSRAIARYIRTDHRSDALQALGLSNDEYSIEEHPVFFASSSAHVDFFRDGGRDVIGTYMISPYYVPEASLFWRSFRKELQAPGFDPIRDIDHHFALAFDSMAMILACLGKIPDGNTFGVTEADALAGQRRALRDCLAQGDFKDLPLLTGITGFDQNGEAIRDKFHVDLLLQVNNENQLAPAGAAPVLNRSHERPAWHFVFFALACFAMGGAMSAAGAFLLSHRRMRIAPKMVPPPVDVRPTDAPDRTNKEGSAAPSAPPIPPIPKVQRKAGEATWFDEKYFFGSDPASQAALQIMQRACKPENADQPVLILGPTGVGKTRLAHLIHAHTRPDRPIVIFTGWSALRVADENWEVAALFGKMDSSGRRSIVTRGAIAEAENGTLLLDEIGDAGEGSQQRLLRLIDKNVYSRLGSGKEEPTTVRIIAATNRDLDAAVKEGVFRRDLLARLTKGQLVIRIPALKEHPWDIPSYVIGLLERLQLGVCISDELLDWLRTISWESNLRHLGGLDADGNEPGFICYLAKESPGAILTVDDRWLEGSQTELRDALESCGTDRPLPTPPDAIFPESFQSRLKHRPTPRAQWEFILDTIFNRLRGPRNQSFLLPRETLRQLSINGAELAVVLELAGREQVWSSLRDSGALRLPEELSQERVDDRRATKYRRELILFAKRSQFLRITHEQLLDFSGLGALGVSRMKLYDLLRYAWILSEQTKGEDIVPPASKYLMGLQRAEKASNPRAQTRPPFRNEAFEKLSREWETQTAPLASQLRALAIQPGRARFLTKEQA